MIKLNEKGFSLVEMMITLTILSVMTSIVVISFSSLHRAQSTKQFLDLLTQDIYYAQQIAMNTGIHTSLYIDNSQSFYGIRQRRENLYTQTFADYIQFEMGSLKINEIAFNPNGNITKPGTLLIRIKDESYRLVFTIGRGRFYIEKI